MRLAALLVFACLTLAALGCGSQEESTPVACLEGAGAYEQALRKAPADVRLAGETPIGDCLASNQSAGELAQVGEAMVEVATALNAEARQRPDSDAALRLGYLLGAAQRGAADSEGIHADLLRRLTVAARFAPDKQPLAAAFLREYEAGYAAGQSNG